MLNRRHWLQLWPALTGVSLIPSLTSASVPDSKTTWLDLQRQDERFLLDINTLSGWQQAAWLLRDATASATGVPDAKLLYLFAWAQRQLVKAGEPTVMIVSSGLRTASSNAATEGAAERSLHLPNQQGVFQAVDLKADPERLKLYYDLFDQVSGLGLGRYSTHIYVDTRGYDARWFG